MLKFPLRNFPNQLFFSLKENQIDCDLRVRGSVVLAKSDEQMAWEQELFEYYKDKGLNLSFLFF
jgi:hypothetical protein